MRRDESRRGRPAKTYTAHGKTMTLAEWSKHLGLTEYALRHRLKRGWATENVFSTTRCRPSEPATYLHDGRELSIPQWAEVTGINKCTLRARIGKGWRIADALSFPTHPGSMSGFRAMAQGPAGVNNARDEEIGTNLMTDKELLRRVEESIAGIGRLIAERAKEIRDQLKALTAPSSIIQVDMESSEEQADGSTLVVLRMRYNKEAVQKWLQ